MPKKSEVYDLFKQVCAFLKKCTSSAHFSKKTKLHFVLFVLKSIEGNYLLIFLNTHSTDTRTVFIDLITFFLFLWKMVTFKRIFQDELSTDRLVHHIYKEESHQPYASVVEVKTVSFTQPTFHCYVFFLLFDRRGWLVVLWVLQQIEI